MYTVVRTVNTLMFLISPDLLKRQPTGEQLQYFFLPTVKVATRSHAATLLGLRTA